MYPVNLLKANFTCYENFDSFKSADEEINTPRNKKMQSVFTNHTFICGSTWLINCFHLCLLNFFLIYSEKYNKIIWPGAKSCIVYNQFFFLSMDHKISKQLNHAKCGVKMTVNIDCVWVKLTKIVVRLQLRENNTTDIYDGAALPRFSWSVIHGSNMYALIQHVSSEPFSLMPMESRVKTSLSLCL